MKESTRKQLAVLLEKTAVATEADRLAAGLSDTQERRDFHFSNFLENSRQAQLLGNVLSYTQRGMSISVFKPELKKLYRKEREHCTGFAKTIKAVLAVCA